MTDERAFLAAILEQPDDDARKLIYADWLEERGDPRGEYVRLMMKVRQERVVTPEQRQRHQELSGELGELRTEEHRAIMAWVGDRRISRENPGRRRRIEELERQLADLCNEIRQQVPARLKELATAFDPSWLSVVSDPEIEGCGRSMGGARIWFDFVCDKTWADMKPTDDASVRHCAGCSKNVYFCDNLADAREHSQQYHCIAVDLGIIRRDGDLESREIVAGFPSEEYFRETYERDLDPVSQARLDARKKGKKERTRRR
jgi:uncharacterized protein (TIGR02996 family)